MEEICEQHCGSWGQLILGLEEARNFLPKLCHERRVKTTKRGKYPLLKSFGMLYMGLDDFFAPQSFYF